MSIMAAKTVNLGNDQKSFISYARSQINYILGDNEIQRSYVVGHRQDSPKRPHHRARWATNTVSYLVRYKNKID